MAFDDRDGRRNRVLLTASGSGDDGGFPPSPPPNPTGAIGGHGAVCGLHMAQASDYLPESIIVRIDSRRFMYPS